jgi:RNA polymerase sigma-70 factor (ECF subfamily)
LIHSAIHLLILAPSPIYFPHRVEDLFFGGVWKDQAGSQALHRAEPIQSTVAGAMISTHLMEEAMKQIDAGAESPFDSALALTSDESLVSAAKAGMPTAYAELCHRHSTKVFRTVQRITRNKEDAEDALQDALLKAFTHLHTFDGRSSFSTWLTRIAINSALMMLRKKRTQAEISFDCETWSHLQIPDPAFDPERHLCEREREFRLRHAVQRLPPVLRGVTEIRYSQDISVIEVAALTSVSVAAAKSRLIRARKLLLHALGETISSQKKGLTLQRKQRSRVVREESSRFAMSQKESALRLPPIGRANTDSQLYM